MREFSWLAIIVGVLIGAALAAANAFVGVKVGMTISASIPAAVMSLLILRTLLKRGTLLESNMVQTIGSAGESVATGMIFTVPALFILGQNAQYLDMVIWGAIGGLLGVCFMVPLRQVLIVREHSELPYPEGVACAEVLASGERGSVGAKSVLWGAIVGAFYYLINGLGFFAETGTIPIRRLRTEFQLESSPALLGVGYILGVRVAAYMLGGAILAWFVLIPGIALFGADAQTPVFPEERTVIGRMAPSDIWENYIRYIGAGAVALGGLVSLIRSFPTILSSFLHVATGVFSRDRGVRDRTTKDFPMPLLVMIVAGLGYAMWHFDQVRIGHVGAIAVIVFTFFFVTVSSRLVGLVGSSSNPVSGMTIATLLATALVFKFFVMGDQQFTDAELTGLKVACLSVGAIVCIAISVAGDTSQDLKTGYLVKATPWKQQTGEMIGVLTSVLAIAGVLLLLNKTQGFTPDRPDPLPAPQANIMKILVDGVIDGQVPWTLIVMGAAAALIIEMLGLPSLPFAVGLYLPLGLSTPIMVGGLLRWRIDRKRRDKTEHDPGTLTAAGLVAGKGLMGVALAGVAVLISWWWQAPKWANPITGAEPAAVMPSHLVPWFWSKYGSGVRGDVPGIANWGLSGDRWLALPLIPFAALTIWLWRCARKRPRVVLPPDAGVAVEPYAPDDGTPPADAGGASKTPVSRETRPSSGPPAPQAGSVTDEPNEAVSDQGVPTDDQEDGRDESGTEAAPPGDIAPPGSHVASGDENVQVQPGAWSLDLPEILSRSATEATRVPPRAKPNGDHAEPAEADDASSTDGGGVSTEGDAARDDDADGSTQGDAAQAHGDDISPLEYGDTPTDSDDGASADAGKPEDTAAYDGNMITEDDGKSDGEEDDPPRPNPGERF